MTADKGHAKADTTDKAHKATDKDAKGPVAQEHAANKGIDDSRAAAHLSPAGAAPDVDPLTGETVAQRDARNAGLNPAAKPDPEVLQAQAKDAAPPATAADKKAREDEQKRAAQSAEKVAEATELKMRVRGAMPKVKPGESFLAFLEAEGVAPLSFSVAAGKLPDGLRLSNGGAISGQVADDAEGGPVSFQVHDANGHTGMLDGNFTV